MENITTLADVWKIYDVIEKKHFQAHDVSNSINSIPDDTPEKQMCIYETLAFDFVENCGEEMWNTYYGPQWTFTKKDTGE